MALAFDKVEGNVVAVTVSGRLTDEDYEVFVPRMEKLIEQWGRLRMLFQMKDDFEGWDASSAWEEFKFEARHRKDLKRVAVVGNRSWEKWMTRLSKLFTGTDVRFYGSDKADDARAWLESGW